MDENDLDPLLPSQAFEYTTHVGSAEALMTQFGEHGRIADLNKAIVHFRQAVLDSSPICLDIDVMRRYAGALVQRYKILREIDDVDEAIATLRTGLDFVPSDPHDRAPLLAELGLSFRIRFDQELNTDDGTEAIRLLQQVLGSPLPALSSVKQNAARGLSALCARMLSQFGHRDDLDRAIRYLLSAEAKACLDDSSRVEALLELWKVLLQHALSVTRDASDVDEVIRCIEEALQYKSLGSALHLGLLARLADAYEGRYFMKFQPEDLGKAITFRRQVISQLPEQGTEEYHDASVGLARTLIMRMRTTAFLGDIEEVLTLCEDALRVVPEAEGSPRRHSLYNLLMYAHSDRFHVTGDIQSLQQVTKFLDLRLQSEDDLSVRVKLHMFGFYQLEREEDFDKAISYHEQVPSDKLWQNDRFADCLLRRYLRGGNVAHLSWCISVCERLLACDDLAGGYLYRTLAYALCERSWIPGAETADEDRDRAMTLFRRGAEANSDLSERLTCAREWAFCAWRCSHSSTTAAYRTALSLLELWVLISPTLQSQQELLSSASARNFRSIALDAASHAVEVGDIPLAVEFLEQGRTLLWSQIRTLRTPHESLSGLDDKLKQRFYSAACETERFVTSTPFASSPPLQDDVIAAVTGIDTLPHHVDQVFSERRRLAKELEGAINDIRKIPGHEDFLSPKPFAELRSAALEGPVVIINLSEYRSDAVIVFYEQEPVAFRLPDFDEFFKLESKLSSSREEYGPASRQFNKALLETMRDLWKLVVSDVIFMLEAWGVELGSRIWWCPTSVATALPFHAAATIIDKRYVHLSDMFVFSYTPTLTALIEARRSDSVSLDKHQPSASFLLVGQPDETLLHVEEEVGIIQGVASSEMSVTRLISFEGTHEVVQENLRTHKWVHFACHGRLAPRDPFDSSFQLYNDARLTLLDITKANIPNAELAFLSACHSAEQVRGTSHEEALHLATAMQIGGFKSVIGTMWAVEDEDGPYVAKEFYSRMFAGDGPGAEVGYKKSARALCEATRAMREDKRYRQKPERWVNFVHIGA